VAIPISIDGQSEVARATLDVGANNINDVAEGQYVMRDKIVNIIPALCVLKVQAFRATNLRLTTD
jgi:dihydropteroate synthase